jgi:fermentation-respiration switch protein FrsA (DUF1100 family)
MYDYLLKTGLVFAFFIFVFFLIRHVERKGLYYPLKTIEATPQDMGLYYEDIMVTTGDGVDINFWYIPADNARATVIFCHGNGGNIGHRLEKIQILHDLNVNVLIFDYRGYGSSGGSPSEEGLYLDAAAVAGYLINVRMFPEEKIVVYGESLGGAVAVDLAFKHSFAGLIIEGGFTSVRDVAKRILPFIPGFVYKSRFDSHAKIGEVRVPKLILHSRDDEVIPFELGKELFEAAYGPKEFVTLEGGHNDAFLLSRDVFTGSIDSFLSTTFKAPPE